MLFRAPPNHKVFSIKLTQQLRKDIHVGQALPLLGCDEALGSIGA